MNNDKNKIAQMVTDQIIEGLKAGHIPWNKPWITTRPHNFTTGHKYSGINPFLCSWYCEKYGYEYPLFASFNQISNAGSHVNKGEHGHIITFNKRVEIKGKPDNDNTDDIESKFIYLLRYYKVFNINQTDINPDKYVKQFEFKSDKNADILLNCKQPSIKHTDIDRACYSPDLDIITLPPVSNFENSTEYYLTAFHELTHWTGHESRLNRLTKTHYGSGDYSQEELIAEIGGNMLAHDCGIVKEVTRNSTAYINNWLTALQNDPKFIIQASSKATQAYDYITN